MNTAKMAKSPFSTFLPVVTSALPSADE